jgi:hypothetical protein
MGLCQQEGHHGMRPLTQPFTPRALNQNKPPFFITHPVYGSALLAAENALIHNPSLPIHVVEFPRMKTSTILVW